jgi:hypothetical protein
MYFLEDATYGMGTEVVACIWQTQGLRRTVH